MANAELADAALSWPFYGLQAWIANSAVSDLRPLAHAHELQKLSLNYTRVHDLTPIASLKKLTELDLGLCPANDLRPLTDLPTLRTLRMAQVAALDLAPLEKIGSLRELEINQSVPQAEAKRFRSIRPDIKILVRGLQLWRTE